MYAYCLSLSTLTFVNLHKVLKIVFGILFIAGKNMLIQALLSLFLCHLYPSYILLTNHCTLSYWHCQPWL